MEKHVIITIAPTGGWGAGNHNPITPEAIATEVIACDKAGASVAHMHSRDRDGNLTADLSCFSQTVELIRQQSDIVIEASTGGLSELTAEERALPASNPSAQMGSLNIGSLNFGDNVYQNSVPDVRMWIQRMQEYKAKPSLEVFDTGHLETALHLIDNGDVSLPANFNFIFGVEWGMPFDESLLTYLIGRLPKKSHWGVTLVGSSGFDRHIIAAERGAAVIRAGFEDSVSYGGKKAGTNVELIEALRSGVEKAGFTVADSNTARAILL